MCCSMYACDSRASFEHIFQSDRAARSRTRVYLCKQIEIFIGCYCRFPWHRQVCCTNSFLLRRRRRHRHAQL